MVGRAEALCAVEVFFPGWRLAPASRDETRETRDSSSPSWGGTLSEKSICFTYSGTDRY